jgi:hypothetical protein
VRALTIAIAVVTAGCGRLGFDDQMAAVDAPVLPDAGPGRVALQIMDNGSPVPSQPVIFQDSAGEVVDFFPTDALGRAEADLFPGSMVTFAVFGADNIHVVTIAGVEPGDELVVGATEAPWAEWLGSIEVVLPGDVPGTATYDVFFGCGPVAKLPTSDLKATRDITRWCAPNGSTAVIAVAFDSDGGALAQSYAIDVVPTVGMLTTVTLPPWSTSWDDLSLNVDGAPPGIGSVGAKVDWTWQGVSYFGRGAGADTTGEPVALGFQRPAGFGDGLHYSPCAYFGTGGASGVRIADRSTSLPGRIIDVDLSPGLPEIAEARITPATDGRPTVSMIPVGAVNADLGAVNLFWTDGDTNVVWRVYLPPDQTELRLPAVPEFLAVLRPTALATFELPQVLFYETDFIAGYRDFKNGLLDRVFESWFLPSAYEIWFSEGPGGFAYAP